jgi:hypothetical protein
MYKITKWFLIIYAKCEKDFFQLYDEAIQKIPNTAFNKKWYRSTKRTFCGQENGMYKYIIGLNNPTLEKLIKNA